MVWTRLSKAPMKVLAVWQAAQGRVSGRPWRMLENEERPSWQSLQRNLGLGPVLTVEPT